MRPQRYPYRANQKQELLKRLENSSLVPTLMTKNIAGQLLSSNGNLKFNLSSGMIENRDEKNKIPMTTIMTNYVGDVLKLANEDDKKDPAKVRAVAELLRAYSKAILDLL